MDEPPIENKEYQFLGNYILKYGKEDKPSVAFGEVDKNKIIQAIKSLLRERMMKKKEHNQTCNDPEVCSWTCGATFYNEVIDQFNQMIEEL